VGYGNSGPGTINHLVVVVVVKKLQTTLIAYIHIAEATIRFLKAKLRVMQEELDRLCAELASKVSRVGLDW